MINKIPLLSLMCLFILSIQHTVATGAGLNASTEHARSLALQVQRSQAIDSIHYSYDYELEYVDKLGAFSEGGVLKQVGFDTTGDSRIGKRRVNGIFDVRYDGNILYFSSRGNRAIGILDDGSTKSAAHLEATEIQTWVYPTGISFRRLQELHQDYWECAKIEPVQAIDSIIATMAVLREIQFATGITEPSSLELKSTATAELRQNTKDKKRNQILLVENYKNKNNVNTHLFEHHFDVETSLPLLYRSVFSEGSRVVQEYSTSLTWKQIDGVYIPNSISYSPPEGLDRVSLRLRPSLVINKPVDIPEQPIDFDCVDKTQPGANILSSTKRFSWSRMEEVHIKFSQKWNQVEN